MTEPLAQVSSGEQPTPSVCRRPHLPACLTDPVIPAHTGESLFPPIRRLQESPFASSLSVLASHTSPTSDLGFWLPGLILPLFQPQSLILAGPMDHLTLSEKRQHCLLVVNSGIYREARVRATPSQGSRKRRHFPGSLVNNGVGVEWGGTERTSVYTRTTLSQVFLKHCTNRRKIN